MWYAAVASFADDLDPNGMSRSEKHACGTEHRAGRAHWPHVNTEDAIDGHSVERAFVTHPLCTRATLFRGLKNQLHGSLQLGLVRFQQLCSAEQHRGVAIVATGVHLSV